MTVFLRADSVTLELPLDVQRVTEGERASGLKAALGGSSRTYRDVLKNISFSAEEGDRIGVLGLNGAGKTTLLRVLNGAFPPTLGKVERSGTMQSLLNVALGFSEYASVTENVFLRGTAMGLRRRQLEAVLPEILEFAGLSDRATHRLHTLSSGQRMRLGFAISTSIQPDILLMDEWIATGDAAFIRRAQDRIRNRVDNSGIVILASHNTSLLRETCNKALVLRSGNLAHFGEFHAGLEMYREIVSQESVELRQSSALSDPLLFGDVTGLVERIEWDTAHANIEGWAISEKGREIESVCVEVDDARTVFTAFDRIDRDDVRRHLAKSSGAFGFRAKVRVNALDATSAVSRIKVSVGSGTAKFSNPLKLAPSAVICERSHEKEVS